MTTDKIQMKILIADDDPIILEILTKRVAQEGYIVIAASNGEMAWQKIQQESPDVIILDLTMPKKDGFEVLKLVRENTSKIRWQPVIIVSARSELEDMRKGYTLEADHYLSKPCSMEDILKAIKLMISLIPRRKLQSETNHEKKG